MKKDEMLLYRANSFPSALAKVFLLFNTAQTIFTLNAVNPVTAGIRIMEIILVNILLSFLVFIAASEMKRYNLRWSYTALAIGIFQLLRYFLIPQVNSFSFSIIAVFLLMAGLVLIISAVWSLVKCERYRNAKKEL